jgi:hypothetical protein
MRSFIIFIFTIIIRLVKSRRMILVGGEVECIQDIGGVNQEERDNCENQDAG